MKKASKVLALVLAFCLLLSVGAFASGEASVEAAGSFAQVDETHWAGDSLTIESVEIAEEYAEYVDSALFGSISKIVYAGGEIDVDYTAYTAVLTVDGVQVDLYNAENVTYTGDVEITLVAKAASTNSGNSKFGDDAGSQIGSIYFTAAAYFDEDGYAEESSVEAAQGGAVIDDTSVSGMVFDSEGDYFSAIYAASGEISITDSTFTAFGKGGDDFSGFGIVAVAAGTANLTIDNCVFVTGGALRSAIWSGGSSTVTVTNTVIQSYNDEDLVPYTTEDNYAVSMMQQVPFALGLTGNIRATLVCGSGNGIYTNCLVASNAWAVLSTDSGSGTLTATDVTAVLGVIEEAQEGAEYDTTATISDVEYGITLGRVGEMSGYIAYCDGFSDYVYGGDWYAPDYLIIITGGSVTVGASDNSRFYGWSDRIGFMSHGTTVNTVLDISEADFDVTDTFVMIKSGGGNGETVNLTDVTVSLTGDSAWSGSLLSVIDTDDLGGGPGATTFVIPYSDYETYLASPTSGEGGETVLNITDSDLTGDVYDSVGSMNGDSFKADSITVNLVNSSLTGVVSSAYAAHCDEDGTLLTGDMTVDSYGRDGTYDYLSIGRIINFAAPTVSNPVSISLENSAWVCTGLSYVASLTIDDASVVDGDVYQDGELIELTAGTYENVVVVPAGADYAQAVADGVTAIETAIAEGITPEDHSDLVANTDMGGMGSSGEASGEASK